MVENFKGCSIQSDEQVDEIVDARNWLRNDSFEEGDLLNDSEKFVVDGSDPKSDPSVATHTTNGFSDIDTTNGISTRKLYTLFIKPVIQAVVRPIATMSRTSFRGPNLVAISVSLAQFREQYIINPRHPGGIIKGDRNTEPFDALINGNSTKNSDPTTFFSHVVGVKAVPGEVADVDASERMNFASNTVLCESPKFVDLRLSIAHTAL